MFYVIMISLNQWEENKPKWKIFLVFQVMKCGYMLLYANCLLCARPNDIRYSFWKERYPNEFFTLLYHPIYYLQLT